MIKDETKMHVLKVMNGILLSLWVGISGTRNTFRTKPVRDQ